MEKRRRINILEILALGYLVMYALLAGTNIFKRTLENVAPEQIVVRMAVPVEWWNGAVVWGSVIVFPAMLIVCALLNQNIPERMIAKASRLWALCGLIHSASFAISIPTPMHAVFAYRMEIVLGLTSLCVAWILTNKFLFHCSYGRPLITDIAVLVFLFFCGDGSVFGYQPFSEQGVVGFWCAVTGGAFFLIYGLNLVYLLRLLKETGNRRKNKACVDVD